MKKRFQNKVATGRLTFHITVGYAVLMSLLGGFIDTDHWVQLVLLAISTMLMVALNNKNSLIRVFSRLVSCIFLVFTIMHPSFMESLSGTVVQILYIISLMCLFKAYQDRQGMGTIFYAFLCIGLISTQFIQVLFFLPLLWYMMFTSLQEGSLRNFTASVLGVLLPYWFLTAYGLYTSTLDTVLAHFASIAEFATPFDGLFFAPLFMSLIFFSVLGVVGMSHFFRYAYADSIRTRMFYNTLMMMFFASIIFIVLQPQHSDYLLRMAIISLAPIVAHYFTFTNTWLTNLFFFSVLAITLTLTILNTWIL